MFLIERKQSAYPVNGVSFDGHKIFIEILPGDDESHIQQIAGFIEKAIKGYAELSPGINYTKSIVQTENNAVQLQKE